MNSLTNVITCTSCSATLRFAALSSVGSLSLTRATESAAERMAWQQRSGLWVCPGCVRRTGTA